MKKHTVFLLMTLLAVSSPAHADAVTFRLTKAAPLPLSLAQFTAESLDGTLALLTPDQQWSGKSISLQLDAGGDTGCGTLTGTIALALTSPNAPKAPDPPVCAFAARVDLTTARGDTMIAAACANWMADVSYCQVEADTGQFWLRRQPMAGAPVKTLELMFGAAPAGAASAIQPQDLEDASQAATDGINTGPAEAENFDPAIAPSAYLWLIWPPGGVTVGLSAAL